MTTPTGRAADETAMGLQRLVIVSPFPTRLSRRGRCFFDSSLPTDLLLGGSLRELNFFTWSH